MAVQGAPWTIDVTMVKLFGDPHLLMFQSDLFQGDQGICEAGLPFEDCGIGALKITLINFYKFKAEVKLKINSLHGSLDRDGF